MTGTKLTTLNKNSIIITKAQADSDEKELEQPNPHGGTRLHRLAGAAMTSSVACG